MPDEQSTDIRLVRAQKHDIDDLAAMAAVIWPEAFADMITRAQIDYMLEHIQSAAAMHRQMDDGMHYHFVYRGDERVGYAGVIHDADAAESKLSKLYILAAHRNGQIAKAALDQICDESRRASSRTLSLTVNKGNARAIRFYEKHGFQTTREIVMDIGGGFVMDDYVMAVALDGAAA